MDIINYDQHTSIILQTHCLITVTINLSTWILPFLPTNTLIIKDFGLCFELIANLLLLQALFITTLDFFTFRYHVLSLPRTHFLLFARQEHRLIVFILYFYFEHVIGVEIVIYPLFSFLFVIKVLFVRIDCCERVQVFRLVADCLAKNTFIGFLHGKCLGFSVIRALVRLFILIAPLFRLKLKNRGNFRQLLLVYRWLRSLKNFRLALGMFEGGEGVRGDWGRWIFMQGDGPVAVGRDNFGLVRFEGLVGGVLGGLLFGFVEFVEEGGEVVVVLVLHLCYFINLESIRMYFEPKRQFQFLKTSKKHLEIAMDFICVACLFDYFLQPHAPRPHLVQDIQVSHSIPQFRNLFDLTSRGRKQRVHPGHQFCFVGVVRPRSRLCRTLH